jgi:hypothetical protein
VVPDISTGSRTYGLLNYLYGPGRRDEHTTPPFVASWMPGLAPDPGGDSAATLKQLTDGLDLPVLALPKNRRPARHVWHCPVRTAPGDRNLSDAEWAAVTRRIVHATGIAEYGDDKACRWIAVRHADDHVHLVATLVREDGRRPRRHEDGIRTQAECRKIEAEFGLQILNGGDRTAAQRPTSAERSKAERSGRSETPRETLRESVRHALAGAASEEEFFHRLAEAGLRVEQRIAPSGDTLGYKVALPGDRNRDGEPVWFSGSKLARTSPSPGSASASTPDGSTTNPSPTMPVNEHLAQHQLGARQPRSPNGPYRSLAGTTTKTPPPNWSAPVNFSTHSPRPPRPRPARNSPRPPAPSNAPPDPTSAPSAPTTEPSAPPPAASSAPATPSAKAKTAAPPRCSCPRWSSSPSPRCAGTPPAATPSKQPLLNELPNTYAAHIDRPPLLP